MSLLKVNEVQNYNGSSLTLTASTVSTSAQLNTGGNISVTGSINVSDDSTTRSNLGLGSIATQNSSNVTITGGNISNATLGSSVTFPAGHVIQTVTDQYTSSSAITITTTSNDYLGSNLQCTITPKANGNKLFIQAFIQGISNGGFDARSLHSGFAYDASFNSGNGTTIGPRAVIADYDNYINQNYTVLGNLQYSIIVTVGTEAPSAGSASIIRPIFQSTIGDVEIATNSNAGFGVFSMMVMEIQA